MNALVYVNININIANFEAFLSVFKLTKNLFFLKSGGSLGIQAST